MAQTYAVAGHKISIGSVLSLTGADFAASDFSSLTYVEIKNWVTMGDAGDVSSPITTAIIGEVRENVSKGTRNAGNMQNDFALLPTDAGQLALIAAQADNTNNYAFKIELTDKPAVGSAPKNSLRYFAGMVMTQTEVGGGANTVRMLRAGIQINSNIVKVAASGT